MTHYENSMKRKSKEKRKRRKRGIKWKDREEMAIGINRLFSKGGGGYCESKDLKGGRKGWTSEFYDPHFFLAHVKISKDKY